jgi:hypothetical protein
MAGLWKQIECEIGQNYPHYLTNQDFCYYAREYIAKGGYSASEANNLILNFKKPVLKKGKPEWAYKINAIARFAAELHRILPQDNEFLIASIPSSLAKSDPKYDSRLDDTLITLKQRYRPGLLIEEPFEVIDASVKAVHSGGSRNPDEIYHNLHWSGLKNIGGKLILIDDIITSGGHFKACQKLAQKHCQGIEVYGIFWARTVWPKEDCNL